MPTVVDNALVIRHWEFSETSQTVCLFCRDHGIVRGLAKGSRREKSRFSGGLELLTRGEIVAITKSGVELATFTEWDLQEVFWSARRSLDAHRTGLYIIDLIHHTIIDHDPHPALWDRTLAALRALDEDGSRSLALLRFQWGLLVEIGYKPALDGASTPPSASNSQQRRAGAICHFQPRAGRFVDAQSSGNHKGTGAAGVDGVWRVRSDTVQALRALDLSSASDAESLEASAATITRANRLLAEYLRVLLDRDLPTRQTLFGPRAGA